VARKKGSDNFGFHNHKPKKSSFGFEGFKSFDKASQLRRPQPWEAKFRPDFNLKDFSILFDYELRFLVDEVA